MQNCKNVLILKIDSNMTKIVLKDRDNVYDTHNYCCGITIKPLRLCKSTPTGYQNSQNEKIIEWQNIKMKVNRALLISKYALDCKSFNESFTELTCEYCTLRSWLKKHF